MKRTYETEAKKALCDYLCQNKDRHFTIEELVLALSKDAQRISRSTVYRQISKLLESGVIRRFETSGEKNFVYQYADAHVGCDAHLHLKCIGCGRLYHMDCVKLDEMREHIYKEHGFIIGGGAVISGICTDCEEAK